MASKNPLPPRLLSLKPWVYGVLFTASNSLLSYTSWSLTAKLWIFLFGVLLPFGLALLSQPAPDRKEAPLFAREIFPEPPRPWWFLVLVLGLALRLGMVVMPGHWPNVDDGRGAYYSAELLRQWRWVFFVSAAQYPALMNWVMTAYYHLVPPSLASLFLYPELFSLGVLFLGWALARRLFSPSFAFLLTFLLAFSFWPLYDGRFCGYMAFLAFWEFLALAALAFWWNPGSNRRPGWPPLLLGFLVGLGYGVSTSWPVTALAVTLAVALFWSQEKKKDGAGLAAYGAPVALFTLLFGYVSLHFHNGAHVGRLWAFGEDFNFLRQLQDSLSNFTALFWGCDLQNSYGPVWGGVLDPLEASCFFLGVLECWRLRLKPWAWLLAASFLVLMAPGVLTKNFDLFRNTQVLPVLLLVAALGAGRLLLSLPSRLRPWALALCLPLVCFLDLRQVLMTFRPSLPGSNGSSAAFAKAYPILREQAQKEGPGALWFELRPHEADQTLAMATYPFNATVNPSLAGGPVKWAALVVDADYRPYLERRFPEARWFDLFDPAHPDFQNTNPVLGVLPLGEAGAQTLESWRLADAALRDAAWTEINLPEGALRSVVFEKLARAYPLFKGDPFLESLYWESAFIFHGWEISYGDRNEAWHYPAALQAVKNELGLGYPTAVFYNELGAFLIRQGDLPGAEKAFEAALHCPVNLTLAAENLRALEALPKTRPAAKK